MKIQDEDKMYAFRIIALNVTSGCVLARFLTSSQVYRNLDLNSLTTFLCLKSICNSLSKTAALSHWQNANYPHPYGWLLAVTGCL